ncbi:MAG: hypothetical protein HYY04_00945 [Chloroflexi bacterium]|nr:hypothetical protein [Chloroflexota bacterium]
MRITFIVSLIEKRVERAVVGVVVGGGKRWIQWIIRQNAPRDVRERVNAGEKGRLLVDPSGNWQTVAGMSQRKC